MEQIPKEEYIAIDLDGTIIENSVFSTIFKKLFFMDPFRTAVSIVSCILLGPNKLTSRHLHRNIQFTIPPYFEFPSESDMG